MHDNVQSKTIRIAALANVLVAATATDGGMEICDVHAIASMMSQLAADVLELV